MEHGATFGGRKKNGPWGDAKHGDEKGKRALRRGRRVRVGALLNSGVTEA